MVGLNLPEAFVLYTVATSNGRPITEDMINFRTALVHYSDSDKCLSQDQFEAASYSLFDKGLINVDAERSLQWITKSGYESLVGYLQKYPGYLYAQFDIDGSYPESSKLKPVRLVSVDVLETKIDELILPETHDEYQRALYHVRKFLQEL